MSKIISEHIIDPMKVLWRQPNEYPHFDDKAKATFWRFYFEDLAGFSEEVLKAAFTAVRHSYEYATWPKAAVFRAAAIAAQNRLQSENSFVGADDKDRANQMARQHWMNVFDRHWQIIGFGQRKAAVERYVVAEAYRQATEGRNVYVELDEAIVDRICEDAGVVEVAEAEPNPKFEAAVSQAMSGLKRGRARR